MRKHLNKAESFCLRHVFCSKCYSRQNAWIIKIWNSSRTSPNRETFPGWFIHKFWEIFTPDVWLCMNMYDYLWLWLTMYDHLWLCMKMFDYVRQFKLFHLIQMFSHISYFSTNLHFVCLCLPLFTFDCLCWNDASMHSFVLVNFKWSMMVNIYSSL